MNNFSGIDLHDWNTFRTAIKGFGYCQDEIRHLWEKYKNKNHIGSTYETDSCSRKLRNSLIAAGENVPKYANAAHHIVAGKSKQALEARRTLNKYGININDAINGVFLPTEKNVSDAAYHPSLHTKRYFIRISEMLTGVTGKECIFKILTKIANQLKNGTFDY